MEDDLRADDVIIDSIELVDEDDIDELLEFELEEPSRPAPAYGSLADEGAHAPQQTVFDPDHLDGEPPEPVPIGRAREYGDGRDLAIVTFGNGLRMSLRVAVRLTAEGYGVRVLDLRWLSPLPVADLVRAAELTGRVLIADETRRSGGVSESVAMALLDAGFTGRIARVASQDSFVPLGAAADLVLLSEADIEEAARKLLA